MSVLIEGMEMPDSCFHCKLAEVCQHYKAEHYANKRHEDCPLEEVPETHEKRTETHTCDCISRQAAIDAANRADYTGLALEDVKKVTDEVVKELKKLPSAQPEPIRINLNEPIKVKLTDWGKEIYYHQYDRTNQIAGREICKPRFPREDENGYTEFQLWCFIELYGMHMGMTLPNVIEPLEIVYER